MDFPLSVLVLISTVLASRAQAATLTWTGGGGDNNWTTTENWRPVRAPANGDTLIFAGTSRPENVNNNAVTALTAIHFQNPGFSLSGTSLTLTGQTPLKNDISNGANSLKLDLKLKPPTVNCTVGGGTLNLVGTLRLGAQTFTVAGGGEGKSALFAGMDTATLGNWKGKYGSDGYGLAGDEESYPDYAQMSMIGNDTHVWVGESGEPRALQRVEKGSTRRLAGTWYGGNWKIDLNLTDGQRHQVAIYCLDWDNLGRALRFDIKDAEGPNAGAGSGALLDSRTVTAYGGGVYYVWTLRGHLNIEISLTGGPNATISAIFFDPPAAAAINVTGATVLAGEATIEVKRGASVAFTGGIREESPGHRLILDGSGIYSLPAAGAYTGGSVLALGRNSPTLILGDSAALGTGPLVIHGGTIQAMPGKPLSLSNAITMNGGFSVGGINSMTFSGPVCGAKEPATSKGSDIFGRHGGEVALSDPSPHAPKRKLTITNVTATFSGPISGNFELVKAGPGTLVLSGANSFNGLSIAEGAVLANNTSGSAAGAGNVAVAAGARLGGTGIISGGVSVGENGILAPGSNGPGTLTLGALMLNPQSIAEFDAGAVGDQLIVTGNFALEGFVNIIPGAGFAPGRCKLITYNGTLVRNSAGFGKVPANICKLDDATPGRIDLVVAAANGPSPAPGAATPRPPIAAKGTGGAPANATPVGGGSGLKGEYFAGTDLKILKLTRVDPKIAFDWTNAPADPSVPRENFSARWTGAIQPRYTEMYTFYTISDDGVRLTINDEPIVENWTNHAALEDTGEIMMEAGKLYSVKLEFFQGSGPASLALSWSSPRQPKEFVPSSQLYPIAPPSVLHPNNKLTITLTPMQMPAEIPALEKQDEWTQSLAALERTGIPQSWLLLGPRPDREFRLFNQQKGLEPETSDDWMTLPRDERGRPFIASLWTRPAEEEEVSSAVDLAEALGKTGLALAYARTEVDWPAAGPALLWFNEDGRAVVYLNNEKVYGTERSDNPPARRCIPLKMKQGRNVFKIKSGQDSGAWGFSFRLERNDPAYRIKLLERMMELYPEEAAGWRGADGRLEIARSFEQLGKPQEALAAYHKAQELFSGNDEVKVAAAWGIRRAQENAGESAEAIGKAWQASEQPYRKLLDMGRATAADEMMREFIARYPFHEAAGSALVCRGLLRLDYGLGEDSRPYFERALREFPLNKVVATHGQTGLAFAKNLRPSQRNIESFPDIQTTLEAARRQMASGSSEDIEKALKSVHETLRIRSILMPVSIGRFYSRYQGTQEYFRSLLASMGKDEHATYAHTVELASRQSLRAALKSGDILALEAVAMEYPYTPAAVLALNQSGNLSMDRGVFAEAASLFKRLLSAEYRALNIETDSHSNELNTRHSALSAPLFAAKLAHALAAAGDSAAARDATAVLLRDYPEVQVVIGGAPMKAGDYARSLQTRINTNGSHPERHTSADYPTLNFDPARTGANETPALPGAMIWTVPLPGSQTMNVAYGRSGGGGFFSHLQPFPIVSDGRLFVSTLESLQAFDLASGKKLWGGAWNSSGTPVQTQHFSGFPASCPSSQNGKVYLRIFENNQLTIRCYLADSGTLCWSTAGNPALKQTIWLNDPVVTKGRAVAAYVERVGDVNVHGVAGLDALTGGLQWKCALASGDTGIRVREEYAPVTAQLGPPSAAEGVVYTPTGLGSMAAFNAFSGEVLWVSSYPTVQINDWSRGNSNTSDNVQHRMMKLLSRGPVPPIIAGDVVVLAPRDAPGLIAFDLRSGEIRWRKELLDSRFLAGVCDGNILAADDTTRAISAATGATVWEYSLPGGLSLYGQPGYSGGVLYLPEKDQLYMLDAGSGALKRSAPWDNRTGGPLGNMIISNGRIIGVNGAVVVFGAGAK